MNTRKRKYNETVNEPVHNNDTVDESAQREKLDRINLKLTSLAEQAAEIQRKREWYQARQKALVNRLRRVSASKLMFDVLACIALKMEDAEDYQSFRLVCTVWNEAVEENMQRFESVSLFIRGTRRIDRELGEMRNAYRLEYSNCYVVDAQGRILPQSFRTSCIYVDHESNTWQRFSKRQLFCCIWEDDRCWIQVCVATSPASSALLFPSKSGKKWNADRLVLAVRLTQEQKTTLYGEGCFDHPIQLTELERQVTQYILSGEIDTIRVKLEEIEDMIRNEEGHCVRMIRSWIEAIKSAQIRRNILSDQ